MEHLYFRLLLHEKGGLSKNKRIVDFCEELYDLGNKSPFLLAFIVDICAEQANEGAGDSRYTIERAKSICDELINQYDTIRANYWQHMLETIENTVKSDSSTSGETSIGNN